MERFDLVIRGGEVVTGEGMVKTDVGIGSGQIIELGDLSGRAAAEELDARGLHVLPGLIDTQVHFREPGLEHKEDIESGTRSALMGGVTTVFEMPNTIPPTTTAESLQDKLHRAAGRAWTNYAFFVGAALDNVDLLAALENLNGTPGIKIFMGSSTGVLLVPDDDHLRAVLRHGARPCPIHAEDEFRLRQTREHFGQPSGPMDHPRLRDAEAARLATERILRLCEETGRSVHILHVSTTDEPPMIAHAKRRGLRVTAEVTPQHLYFQSPDCYEELGTLAQMNPPIRSAEHREALRRALREGVFDMIGSDHAPHTLEEKAKPYPASPSGMPGTQTLLPVMLDFVDRGLLDLPTLVRLTSENPARIYGIRAKGRIAPGFDADLTLVDAKAKWTIEPSWVESKCGWSPFTGKSVVGRPIHVVLAGRVAVRDGAREGSPAGRMVEFDWKPQTQASDT
ncbi:MAG TPA: dihydroorotase [Fimbriimonadaceae bacterium]|nr:dihydroorotase [Fimbriimonadaceae bacterium]HRJ97771.1 dihydroorotase [Fimbriimonadaceae bacterium]